MYRCQNKNAEVITVISVLFKLAQDSFVGVSLSASRQRGALWVLLSTKYYYGAQIKEAEMGGKEMENPFCTF